MAEKLKKSILYDCGIADLFFIMRINMGRNILAMQREIAARAAPQAVY